MITVKKSYPFFGHYYFLSFIFMFIELSLYLQTSPFSWSDVKVAQQQYIFNTDLKWSLFYFFLIEIGIHGLFTLFIWFLCCGLILQFSIKAHDQLKVAIVAWIFSLIYLLCANFHFFPFSRFSLLVSTFINYDSSFNLFLVCSFMYGFSIFFALLGFFTYYFKLTLASVFIIFFSMLWGLKDNNSSLAYAQKNHTMPNIILIGMDSVRPDFIHYFGGNAVTPFLDSQLKKSFIFNNALTPLARTFPAWISILTGLYPKHSGMVSNLMEQNIFDHQKSLAATLKRYGYTTLYATDETRFSNILPNLGFDKIITPCMGLKDFVLGTLNDFPLSNFIINTKLGAVLFPYSYANRAVYHSYDPESFIQKINANLDLPSKPLFMAIHFCLPHFPYFWNNVPRPFSHDARDMYQNSLSALDSQIESFYQLLKQRKLLDHAIIIFLSDHGEALGLNNDRILQEDLNQGMPFDAKKLPRFQENYSLSETAGHGTDILSLSQYHVLLAIQWSGKVLHPKANTQLVSLLDIKPTLLDLLGISANDTDGHSLLPALHQNTITSLPIHFFMESDFSPQAIRQQFPDIKQVMIAGLKVFRADEKTGLLYVRKDKLSLIIASKQYADIYGDWMLALYPQSDQRYLPIIVNLQTGRWSWQLDTTFAKHSPAKQMLSALRNFYQQPFLIASP